MEVAVQAALERISRLEATVQQQQQRIAHLERLVCRGPQLRPAAVSPAAAARVSTAKRSTSTSPAAVARASAVPSVSTERPVGGRAGGRDELKDSLGLLTNSYEQKLRDSEARGEGGPTATTKAATRPHHMRSSAPDILSLGNASSLRPRSRSESQQLRPRSEEVLPSPAFPLRPVPSTRRPTSLAPPTHPPT